SAPALARSSPCLGCVELAEGLALRRRHVAPIGPAAAQGQAVNQALPSPHPLEHPHTDARGSAVQRGTACKPRPGTKSEALRPWAQMPLELLLAQFAQQVGERNFHRTDYAALIAQ